MSRLDSKVVAITGASSGIGAATALELAARGAAVVLGARRTDRLDSLVARIRAEGGRAEMLDVDVTKRADLEQLVALAVNRFGHLDVLVANAGVARIAPMADLDVDDWDVMIDVNLRGVLHGIAAALPVFRRQGHGHLVTTVSTSGLKIVPTQAVYAGTKNAVRTLLEALRQESTDGVLVTGPGAFPGRPARSRDAWGAGGAQARPSGTSRDSVTAHSSRPACTKACGMLPRSWR
jgi:NADP-dependent 3-hydroxy acid dehydrogenase YdfG